MMKLTDESPMPWGKYKGRAMEDVPAGYLVWMADGFQDDVNKGGTLHERQQMVLDYYNDNKDVLHKQCIEESQQRFNSKS